MADYKVLALVHHIWVGPWMNRQQMLSRLGAEVDVVYSCVRLTNWDIGGEYWHKADWIGHFKKMDNVWVDSVPKWLLEVPKYPFISNLSERLEVARLRRFLGALGPDKLLMYVYRPEFLQYVERLQPDVLVYHAFDVYDTEPTWNEKLAQDQKTLMKRADMVLASSDQMADRLRVVTEFEGEIRVLKNGADVEAFHKGLASDEPDDLKEIPHPRISYVGRLNNKVDFSLVLELANRHPEWQLIFVGPEAFYSEATKPLVEACRAKSNVHFLGNKTHQELPHYVAAMDVNTMCYLVTDKLWSFYGFPLKLHEYLAVGKPVVSADLGSVREYSDVIAIAHTTDEWDQYISEALDGNGRGDVAERQRVASENSWDDRVATLKGWLDELAS